MAARTEDNRHIGVAQPVQVLADVIHVLPGGLRQLLHVQFALWHQLRTTGQAHGGIVHLTIRSDGQNIARMLGLPDYPFVRFERPISSRPLSEIKTLAEAAYNQALPILMEA